jgi:hypothetical protein
MLGIFLTKMSQLCVSDSVIFIYFFHLRIFKEFYDEIGVSKLSGYQILKKNWIKKLSFQQLISIYMNKILKKIPINAN